MQAEVYVGVTRPTQASELWCAIAEAADSRIREISVVGKPLNTRGTLDRRVWGNLRQGIAVGSRPAGEGARVIRSTVNGEREARAEGEDGADFPPTYDGIDCFVGIMN